MQSDADAVPGVVGVLGGMGPLATVDFMQKLIAATSLATQAKLSSHTKLGTHTKLGAEATQITRDQDHIPVVVSSIPQIPDRAAAYWGEGVSPLPAMVSSGQRLRRAGAGLIVMPCHTAHLWFDELKVALDLPMLHLVDAALEDALAVLGPAAPCGLLCTEATLASGLYMNRAAQSEAFSGLHWTLPTATEMTGLVTPGIQAAKLGKLLKAGELLSEAAHALVRRGARGLLLGCTEIPLVMGQIQARIQVQIDVPVIDATASLARRAVAWSLAQRD